MPRLRVLGLVVLAGLPVACRHRVAPCPARETPPAPVAQAEEEHAPLAVPMPAVSGLAPVDAGHYLVVHDAKAGVQPRWPRVAILTLHDSREHVSLAYEPIPVDWGEGGPSNDLEALCVVPGRPGEFLLAESSRYEGKYGRVFHARLSGRDGSWRLAVVAVGALPTPPVARQVEGMACVARSDGSLRLFLGERDSRVEGQASGAGPGTLRWGRVELAPPALKLVFAPEDQRPLDVRYSDGTSPGRTCSDLFVDASGMLWGAACDDPDDDRGPFRSAVYRIGPVDDGPSPVGTAAPHVVWTLDGMKVEAVSAGYKAGELSVGTDDEDYGGCWRRLLIPKP